jgi:ABC-type sugar transport system ATPase subunit
MIVMDEPSAALSPHEVERLLAVVRELAAQGIGIIYVSHRLEEIFQIAGRITVLRDGAHVATRQIAEVTRETLIELMVGRRLDQEFPRRSVSIGPPRLVVRDLTREPRVRGVTFDVRRGEIVALTGLVGAGRTETARMIFGADRAERGTVSVDGRTLRLRQPRDAIRAGICLLTEDRKAQGLILRHSVQENFSLPNMRRFAPGGLLRPRREREAFDALVKQLHIRVAGRHQPAATLSGGNQQKVVLAKWLASRAEIVLFDEPTRGIDVGAKYEIYLLMNELAAAGKAILMISSELPEVLGMADRILVMHEGRVTGEIPDASRATQEQIMELAVK